MPNMFANPCKTFRALLLPGSSPHPFNLHLFGKVSLHPAYASKQGIMFGMVLERRLQSIHLEGVNCRFCHSYPPANMKVRRNPLMRTYQTFLWSRPRSFPGRCLEGESRSALNSLGQIPPKVSRWQRLGFLPSLGSIPILAECTAIPHRVLRTRIRWGKLDSVGLSPGLESLRREGRMKAIFVLWCRGSGFG